MKNEKYIKLYLYIFLLSLAMLGMIKKLNSNETSLSQEIISKNQQQEKEIWKFYKISENPIFEIKKVTY